MYDKHTQYFLAGMMVEWVFYHYSITTFTGVKDLNTSSTTGCLHCWFNFAHEIWWREEKYRIPPDFYFLWKNSRETYLYLTKWGIEKGYFLTVPSPGMDSGKHIQFEMENKINKTHWSWIKSIVSWDPNWASDWYKLTQTMFPER